MDLLLIYISWVMVGMGILDEKKKTISELLIFASGATILTALAVKFLTTGE